MVSPLEVVQNLYAAFTDDVPPERRRPPESVFAEDVVWYQAESHPLAAPGGRAWVGLDALQENVNAHLVRTFEDFHMEEVELLPAGDDRVVATGRYVGTHRHTGDRLNAQFCLIYTVAGGKIVEGRQFVDTAQVRDLMGSNTAGPGPQS